MEEDPVTKHPFYFFTVIRRRRQGSSREDTHGGLLAAKIVPVYVNKEFLAAVFSSLLGMAARDGLMCVSALGLNLHTYC